ncbi:MAG TPA: WD40 repeat domain-containing protein [Thermoanaerobaculia bacterium]|nr:WD40 repeat domain-containing protein [Thermoanaerobaculia bacterium]
MQQFATSPYDSGPLEIVSTALRANAQRVNEAPADVAAILYSALRRDQRDDDEVEELLGLRPLDLPLRIESYDAQTSERARLRPPGPVVAMHVNSVGALIVRCPNALMLVDPAGIATTIHTSRLTASGFTSDGQRAVTGDVEGTVTFWNMPNGASAVRFEAHRGEVTHIVAAGGAVYSCGADGEIVHWDVGSGQPSIADRYTRRVTSAAAFEDEAAFGCADGSILEISPRGTVIHAKAHEGAVLAIARAEDVLYSAGADRKLRICPVGHPGDSRTIDSGHTLGVTGLIAAPDRRSLVTYSGDRTATLRDTYMNARLLEHDAAVTVATIVPGRRGEFLITGTADGSLYVWDMSGGFVRRQLRFSSAIRACVFHDDELITGGDDRDLVRTGLDLVARPDASVSSCSSIAKGLGICRGGTFNIRYDGGAGGVGGSAATSISLRPDGQRAVVWDRSARHVREWDVQRAREQEAGPFNAGVFGAGYVGNVIAVALESGEVAFARGSGPVGRVWRPHDGPIAAMATNSSAILTAGIDGTIALTRPGKGSPLDALGKHRSRVTALAANDRFAVSGTGDGEVIMWDLEKGRLLPGIELGFPVSILAMASDRIVVASDSTLAIVEPRSLFGPLIARGHRDRITALLVDDRSQLVYTASLDRTVRAWDFQGQPQGIVYGDHPFSVLAPIHSGILPGEILAGDDGGAVWTFSHRGDVDADTPPIQVNRPLRVKTSPKKAAPKKPASKKARSKMPSSLKQSNKFSSRTRSSKKRKLK